ncbi:RND family efflux transporter MFP subunit [Aliidiomarina maris]|uniref:RND family efflux transporter MFP subunit n=3 Tax=Aliidiomarina maris TaxID=531312 RepID=A0A327X4J1_9GAMM|nr:RND family efflux transporter MFP subunit [Aliidiomarina maris]
MIFIPRRFMPGVKLRFSMTLLTATALLLSAYASMALAQDDRRVLVVTESLSFEQQVQRVDAVGSARALRSVTLYPAVADRVTEVNIVPGQWVTQDSVLLRLDNRRQRVALDRARIQLEDAQRTVDRLQSSLERRAIAQSELDDATTLRDLAQIAFDEAETEYEDRIVRAPFDGVVGITDIQVGDRINEQTAITTIDDSRQLYIDFRAPESALALIQHQGLLQVTPWQQAGESIAAQVVEVDSRFDIANRTIRVRAIMNNDNQRFRPGSSFRVSLQLNGEYFASIPEAALMWGPTSAYVWTVEDQRANRVDVQIKQRLRGRVLIDGDLEPGQTIITEGVQSVRQGQQVRPESESYEPSESAE